MLSHNPLQMEEILKHCTEHRESCEMSRDVAQYCVVLITLGDSFLAVFVSVVLKAIALLVSFVLAKALKVIEARPKGENGQQSQINSPGQIQVPPEGPVESIRGGEEAA